MLVTAEVDEVVAPGSEGYFGVLPGHAPFLTTLGIGEVMLPHRPRRAPRRGRGRLRRGAHRQASSSSPSSAETPDEIDRARAEKALERAETRLGGRGGEENVDFNRARSTAARAFTRLSVAGRHR